MKISLPEAKVSHLVVPGFVLLVACAPTPPEHRDPPKVSGAETARLEARFRQRRIIMNNDGNDNPTDPVTPKTFLARRTSPSWTAGWTRSSTAPAS